jgi:hypothetical protein
MQFCLAELGFLGLHSLNSFYRLGAGPINIFFKDGHLLHPKDLQLSTGGRSQAQRESFRANQLLSLIPLTHFDLCIY